MLYKNVGIGALTFVGGGRVWFEHMFDEVDSVVELWPGEGPEDLQAEDQLAYRLTCLELADGWTEPDRHVLPSGLEGIGVGPFLAAVVSAVDAARLNGHDAVRLMQARGRLASHHEAGKLDALAEVAFSPPGDAESPVERSFEAVEYAAVEVAAGLTLTRRASEGQLELAVSLSGCLHRVRNAFSRGLLDLPKVRVFDQMLSHLPQDTINTVLDRILEDASGLTTGQLRARLACLVLEADPDGSKSSFEEGLADRKVTAYPNPDHTANFGVYSGHPEDVTAARRHVEKLARHIKSVDDTGRSLDQIRADVALDLLAGKCGHYRHVNTAGGGRINVTVSAETLAGLSDAPGVLDGYGPVFAEIVRKTVHENIDGEWVFTVTDQGKPVATGTLSRRPTVSQQRHIETQYPTCVMVGCRQPIYDCDLDHRRSHSQRGPRHNDNLGPLCRHHHMVKHHTRWKLQRLPNGDHQWTSPLGHNYIKRRGPPD